MKSMAAMNEKCPFTSNVEGCFSCILTDQCRSKYTAGWFNIKQYQVHSGQLKRVAFAACLVNEISQNRRIRS